MYQESYWRCERLFGCLINFRSVLKRHLIFIGVRKMKEERDIEKDYSTSEFVSKLRRLADSLESGEKFEIQIAGERIYVPVRAEYNIEHEREGTEEEIEFQIK